MGQSCRCGSPVRYHTVAVACIECGTECCPCCTLMFESAPYCIACFEELLEVAAIRVPSMHALSFDTP
jgi:hypothetical protein